MFECYNCHHVFDNLFDLDFHLRECKNPIGKSTMPIILDGLEVMKFLSIERSKPDTIFHNLS